MRVLLLTDGDDFETSLPTLDLFSSAVRRVSLTGAAARDCRGIDVGVVDARTDLPAARASCRRLAAWAPSAAVVAVLAAADFVAVNTDWHVDDVLLATAGPAELCARLRLAVARRHDSMSGRVQFGDLVLDLDSYTASLADRELELTLTEFRLLNYLVRHAGRAFTRADLMHEVWGGERSCRTVDVHVQRLRAKLGSGYESIIDTVRGVGYMVHLVHMVHHQRGPQAIEPEAGLARLRAVPC